MPMIRCPHCELHQYASTTRAKLPECAECGRPLALPRTALIAPVIAAVREVRTRSRHRIASSRS
jgi:ribosomal protein S27E